MAKTLKVYGWTGWIEGRFTREVIAVTSKTAAIKEPGALSPNLITETRNDEEIAQAMSEPGAIFWTLRAESLKSAPKTWSRK